MKSAINVGVVGATGLVGETFLHLLNQRNFPFADLKLFASENSQGQTRTVQGRSFPIETLQPGCFDGLDLVFFSSGEDISKEWAPRAAAAGAFAVDNSSAFRMDPGTPLVVPEVNRHRIPKKPGIIGNPNCSTIQMVVLLNALKGFDLKSVKVSSYQAASGAGKAAQQELREQLQESLKHEDPLSAQPANQAFPVSLAFNCIPQIGGIGEDGCTTEELKLVRETKKILEIPELPVSAFAVRIPAWNVHSEALWVELDQTVGKADILKALEKQAGLIVSEGYPTAHDAHQKGDVFVGRVHRDPENPKTWLFWVVADNLLKGAALNGLQIAEWIFDIRPGP